MSGPLTTPGTPALVAGLDEAGRGPLAGPVCAAAVILDPGRIPNGLDDSKRLTEALREALAPAIEAAAIACAVAWATHLEVDRLNVLQASMLAMRRALLALRVTPTLALVDGNRCPDDLPCVARAVVGGDGLEPAISAASILAKVARDREMQRLDAEHPQYGFARHKGYPTAEHLESLRRHGPCAIHRRSFAPVRALLDVPTDPVRPQPPAG
ncbi:ribonuclease HII [uncultured Thiohalocapsa sp.]|uniref:ribonuclease HII n=1 Tax=uncultured Thiohalocapsa sp. TaxID=768990 RepID=UPI0025F7A7D2|nr:ribonuclease HII [uncultured Thiohalocapsa sp.]